MRVSGLIPLLMAAIPAAALDKEAGGLLGFALGNKNADGNCKVTDDYKADFDALKSVATLVRTYSSSDCDTAKNIIPAAKEKGFKVVLGVWPDYDQSFNEDLEALKSSVPGNEETIRAITVGSECLYRGSLSADKLLDRINQVKNQFPKLRVGMVDSWNKFNDGSADPIIAGGVDYFLANGFAYWQDKSIDDSSDTYFYDMSQAMDHIQSIAGDNAKNVRFGNGETGWPTTGGSNYGAAVASTENAERYWKESVCGMLAWGVDVFYFEAFDESWKPLSKGDNGQMMDETHWGLFTADRKLKFDTTCKK